jgi:flagellar protein FlaJ
MATATRSGSKTGVEIDWRAVVVSIAESYDQMEIPLRRYATVVLLPATVVFLSTLLLAVVTDFGLVVKLPALLLGLLGLTAAVVYPRLLVETERRGLERQLHLLLTHMTVLSATNVDRVEVFRILSREREYDRLAVEMTRIVNLVDIWKQSLDEACQLRARRVPSKPLADLLDRLAYSLSAGQDIQDFLLSEQKAVIRKYVTVYEGALDNIEVMKDLYLSMVLSMTFALVNAVVLPMLTGVDPTLVVAAVIVVFVFVQIGFLYVIRAMAPYDPVWYRQDEYRTRSDWILAGLTYGGATLSLVVIAVFGLALYSVGPFAALHADLTGIPLPIMAAIPITPLIVPGLYIRHLEGKIADRDKDFPAFIRALGASETAKQATTSAVLRTLRKKDFGTLSNDVDALYARLSCRLDTDRSWYYFSAESRSYLIQKFSEMYNVGRTMGGDPKTLGELISVNMGEVLKLREQRKQATTTLIGIIYGVSASAAFTFFIGLEVVVVLAEISNDMGLEDLQFGQLIYASIYDVAEIEYLLVVVVLANAVLSALMIRQLDGGHKANTYLHLVLLVWISALLAVGTRHLAGGLL